MVDSQPNSEESQEGTSSMSPLGASLRALFLSNEYDNTKAIFGFFFLMSVVFYADKVFLMGHAPIRMHDTFEEFGRIFNLGTLLFSHGLFGWFPNVTCGLPAYSYIFAPYYPWCLLSNVLPLWAMYSLTVILMMNLAGYGMYLFLRRYLRLTHWNSLLGGTLFAMNSQIQPNNITFLTFNYVFPLFFVFSMGFGIRAHAKTSVLASVGVISALSILSVAPLTLAIFSVLQAVILLLLKPESKARTVKLIVTSVLVWTGYALMHFPTIFALSEFLAHYHRAAELIRATYLTNDFLTSARNYFFDCAQRSATLLILVASVPFMQSSSKLRRAAAVSLTFLSIAAFYGSSASWWIPRYLERMDLSHFSWVLPFCMSVLAALFVDEMSHSKVPGWWLIWLVVAVPAVLVASLIFLPYAWPVKFPLVLLNAVVMLSILCISHIACREPQQKGYIQRLPLQTSMLVCTCLCLVVTGMLFRWVRLAGPEPEWESYYRYFSNHSVLGEKLDRRAGGELFRVGAVGLPPAVLNAYGAETIDARGAVFFRTYKNVFRRVIGAQLKTKEQQEFFDAYPYDLYLGNSAEPELNLALLSMMNVKYIVSLSELPQLKTHGFAMTIINPDRSVHWFGKGYMIRRYDKLIYVYESKSFLERGYLVAEPIALASDDAVLDALAAESIEGLRRRVFFQKKDLSEGMQPQIGRHVSDQETSAAVNITHYGPDRIVFKFKTDRPQFLVVTNNYHPNWKASVDGQDTSVMRANHAFQAVYIDRAGKHEVILEFRDPWLWWAHLGIPLGILVMAAGVWCNNRRATRG